MTSLIILVLYSLVVLTYLVLSFFIVYHLANFSIKSGITTIVLFFFIILSLGLLITNAALFFSVNWNYLLSNLLS